MSADDLAGAAAAIVAAAAGPTAWQFAMLGALQSKPMYQGTVSAAEKRRRRAKGKAAKAARKANR